MKMRLSRRRFLQAVGLGAGAGLLTPLLGRVWAEDQGILPHRIVIVVTGNGIEPHNFISPLTQQARQDEPDNETLIEVSGGDLASAPALASLAGGNGALDLTPHAATINALSSKIAGGGHTAEYKALSASKERSQTIDAWLADRLHTDQPFSAVRLGVTESAGAKLQYNFALQNSARQLPIIVNPADGHTTLFGSIATGSGGRAFEVQADLLDFAKEDVKRVQQTFSGGSRERQKLDNYLAAIEELREQQSRLVASGDTLRALAEQEGLDPDDGSALNVAHPLGRLHGQFRLATAALLGNLTNVVLLTNSVGYSFSHTKYTSLTSIFQEDSDFSGEVPWRHGVCHEAGGNPVYQKVLDRVIERQVEMIAEMARKLAAVPEGDGTMLDHTAIVFMSDNGSTHHSEANNWPTLVLGGSQLGLQTGGRSLLYPTLGKERNARVSNLFNTLGYAAGHPLDDFGGEPDRVERGGPLSALLS